jgi:hypothetical protein
MSGHLIQIWMLYFKSKKENNNHQTVIKSEEEMEALKSSNDN